MTVLNDPNHRTGDSGTGEDMPKGSTVQRTGMSSGELLIELRNQKLIDRELSGENTKAPEEKEGLAATIVKAALESQAASSKEYKALADRNDAAAQEARRREDEAKKETNKIVADQISGALVSLEKMREEIRGGNTPNNWIEQLKSLKELERTLSPAPHPAAERPVVSDGSLSMQLEGMRMNHELAIKKMDLEMARMAQDLQIRLAEFSDKRTQTEREYLDGKQFRQNAFSTVTDILGAASAGLAAKVGSVPASQHVETTVAAQPSADRPVSSDSQVIKPKEVLQGNKLVHAFACKTCGSPIAVEPGSPKVTCPNPQCREEYSAVPGT